MTTHSCGWPYCLRSGIHLFFTAMVILASVSMTYAGEPCAPQIPSRATAEPLYLLIVGGPETFSSTFTAMAPGSPRHIGFAPVLYTLKTSEEELALQVNAALDKAEQTGYPVFFHLDDWNFPEDWKDPGMVEWTAFPKPGEPYGPLVRRRWINWGSWIVTAAPPNYESPEYKELLKTRIQKGVAGPIVQRLHQWNQSGKAYLFAGLTVGWETGFYSMTEIDPNNRPSSGHEVFQDDELVRTGFAALSARGYNQERINLLCQEQGRNEEQVMYDLMVDVLHDHTQFMAQITHESGIPIDRIYSHYAAMRSLLETAAEPRAATSAVGKVSPMETMLRANPKVLESMKLHGVMVPLKAAINPYCRPGITAAFDFSDPLRAAREIQQAGYTDWGAVEIEITGTIRDASSCLAHLEELTDLGARVICVYGWWEKSDNEYSVQGTGAVEAMRHWLNPPGDQK